jgi:hypothetical protein
MDAQDPRDPHDPYSEPDPVVDGDAVDHLWNAAHEMLSAMRTLLDAADEFVESQRGGRASMRRDGNDEPREARVHHIDIDIDVRADSMSDHAPDSGASRGFGAS